MNPAQLIFRLILGRRAPITSGRISVAGLTADVTIGRDGWGVPHIRAESDADAWYAVGFCMGQDRAFQLESTLRTVRGTLAEVLGSPGLPIDRLSRRIGFYRAGCEQIAATNPELRIGAESYARGVTAGMTIGMRRKAHEFSLLRITPTPWTAADVAGHVKLISFLAATNWDLELARLTILHEDGAEALAALDTRYPDWQPVISPPTVAATPAVARFAEEAALLGATIGGGGGSNNWAIAPSRTTSGRPILANDPHLPSTLPPHWYLAHVSTPEWSVAGACFVGAPSVLVGHNGCAAWGVTFGMTDNTDLFLEDIGPDGCSVREGEGWVPCETRTEWITVKGAEEVVEHVLVTPRGPIVSPALGEQMTALSLRATWLDPAPMDGFFSMHRVHSFEAFHRCMEHWPALPLNVAYADTSGTIGWQLIGTAPRRKSGVGAAPLPGWEQDVGWEDTPVPYEDMPYLSNPATGFVASANNQAIRNGDGPFLTVDWLDGYRAARIVAALEARTDWNIAGTGQLQMDVQSVPWSEMREIVLAVHASDRDSALALALLRCWDGNVTPHSPAATIFELFVAELCTRVATAKAPRSWRYVLGKGFHPLAPDTAYAVNRVGHLSRLLREQPNGWFEQTWNGVIADSLSTVVRRLRAERGTNQRNWTWGAVRPLTLVHAMGQRKPLDRIFNLSPFPWGGDANTVLNATVEPLAPTDNPSHIQSLRFVCEVGEWETCTWVLPGGQSGNPVSVHYADQVPLWQRGEGIPIPWSDDAVRRAVVATLQLEA